MMHELFDRHRLDGAPNFRDLGGLPAADGRHIKPCRLLRCGQLADITPEDSRKLVEDYRLKVVVDFRTDTECMCRPDIIPDGVSFRHCPIFQDRGDGIVRNDDGPYDPVASALRMAHNNVGTDAHGRLADLYNLFLEDYGAEHYAEFFNILLAQEDGSVLWHCSMGKDRCGTGAYLVEIALGVPEEIAMADYLYSNVRNKPVTEETIRQALLIENDPALMDVLRIMDSVHPDFINTAIAKATATSGSVMGYIQQKLGMTDEKLTKLREMYLE